MTSYQPAVAPRVTPARLVLAGVLSLVLSIALIFATSALFGATSGLAVQVGSLAGRMLFVAGVTLVVLAAVRRLDRR